MTAGKTRQRLAQQVAAFDRREGQGIDADIGVTAAIEFQDVELDHRMDRSDQDLPAAERQRAMRRLEIWIAHRVEHDVGALAAGQLPHARGDAGGGRVDDFYRPVGMALVSLVLADDADHSCAAPGRKLRRGLADLAIQSHDHDGVLCSRHAGAAKSLDRGHERHADAGGLFHRDGSGLFDQSRRLDNKMRRVGAVAADAEISGRAEHFTACPFGRPIDNDTGKIPPRRSRENRVGHQAGGGLDVGGIDAGRLDFHDCVIRSARQHPLFDRRRKRRSVLSFRVQA